MHPLNIQTCSRCGEQWINTHYCPKLNAPHELPTGAVIQRPLTEADVRRIVREELERASSGGTALNTTTEALYDGLHSLSKILESSGLIDQSRHTEAYGTILDAMAFVRRALDSAPAETQQAAPVALTPLTDAAILRIVQRTAHGDTVKVTRDVGPYQITEPTPSFLLLVRAIERAHGIGAAAQGGE